MKVHELILKLSEYPLNADIQVTDTVGTIVDLKKSMIGVAMYPVFRETEEKALTVDDKPEYLHVVNFDLLDN